LTDNLIKRSNNLVNVVTKALNANAQSEPAYIRLREEAEAADKVYRVAVRRLDRQRLGLEERIEETLKTLQRWELERLRAVKTGKPLLTASQGNESKSFQCYFSTRVPWPTSPRHSNHRLNAQPL
jgi:hypothetical protein